MAPDMETTVWTGRGFYPKEGTLRLVQGRLQFTLGDTTVFDAPIAELKITWPWYGFGCQFWAHTMGQKYFISFLHTNNTMGTWLRGVQRGREWHRAITAAAVVLMSLLALPANAQDANLAAGRQLVAQLKLDQPADSALLEQVGFDRASVLLTAVMTRGQDRAATRAEWTEMHRAVDGLVELSVAKKELFKAAVYANFQEIFYRNNEGDYSLALGAARQALELQQKSGETKTLYLVWKNVGENLIRLGKVDEALDALYQSHRTVDDPFSSLAGLVWREIVEAEIARKNMEAAKREAAEFVRVAEGQLSAAQLFRGRALLARADLEMELGRHADAIATIKAAGQAVTEEKSAESFGYEVVAELMTLGMTAMQTLPYEEAMALVGRIEKEFPKLPLPLAGFARQIAEHRRRLAGDFEGLLRDDTAALAKARAAKDVPEQIDALVRLAVTYSFANSARQQITLLEEAMELQRGLVAAPATLPTNATAQYYFFRTLDLLGQAYANNKDIVKARKCFDEITRGIDSLTEAAARAKLVKQYGNALLGKALVAELDEDPDTARDILEKALKAGPNGPAKFTRGDVLLQFARLERNLNERPTDAVRYYEEAIQEVHAARDLRTEISVRLQLARYLVAQAPRPENLANAAAQLELAQTAANAIEYSDAQWRVRFLQGVVAENAGRTDEAIAAYRDAVARLDRLRAGLPQQEQRQAFMDNESIQELYQRNIALLTSAGRQAEAWEYLERGKARAFLEGLQGRRFRSTVAGSGASGDLEKLETQIVNLRAQLTPGNESVLRGAGREPALAHAELQQLEARFSAARQEAAISASRATQPLSLKPISIAEVRKALPPHAALVEYAVLEGKLTAFVVTPPGANQVQWEAKTKTLGNRIRQLRDLMSNPGSGEQLPPLLQDVSEELVAPVVKALPAGTDRLLIVPSQALNYIPFQALLLPDGRAMVEQYTISYLPSASTLQFLKPAEKASSDDLFMAALGNVSTEGWAPLPGTLAETAAIAKLYPKAPRITEGEFTHDAAVRALQEHEQVHFATHGLFDESAPLFSALLLGSSEGGRSRLSLYEIMDLKLRARLVVLSACETNRGKLMGGDEVAGLTRTFLTAGAETVVSSLWKVSDESTALLMQGLYRRLRAGVAPSTALRESELEVRKQFPHPFFWAPFVETGVM